MKGRLPHRAGTVSRAGARGAMEFERGDELVRIMPESPLIGSTLEL
jgi:hypothetical protein